MKQNTKRLAICLWCLSVILQFVHVFVTGDTFAPDEYKGVALKHAIEGNLFYPCWEDLIKETIIAPGWMNLASWLLYIIPDYRILYMFNILAVNAIVFIVFYLSKKYISENSAWIGVFLFSIYPTWIIAVNRGNSEIPYMFFFFLSIYLLSYKNYWLTFAAGLALGYANWCRPFLPVMLIIAFMFIYYFHNDFKKRIVPLLVGCLLLITIVGGFTYSRLGRFEYQSTMQGFNILLGAHDEADGTFRFCNPKYLPDMNGLPYYQRDSIYKAKAVEWIKEHPMQWLSTMPNKFAHMFLFDSHATMAQDPKCQMSILLSHRGLLSFWQIITCVNLIIYYFLMMACLWGLYLAIKYNKLFVWIWGFFLLLSIMASMLTVGINRYHFVLMPIVICIASYGIDKSLKKSKQ